MGEEIEAWRVLVRTSEGKRPLGRPELRWENIKVDLQEIGWGDVDRDKWRALVNMIMNRMFIGPCIVLIVE